jgi:hypothetical protein
MRRAKIVSTACRAGSGNRAQRSVAVVTAPGKSSGSWAGAANLSLRKEAHLPFRLVADRVGRAYLRVLGRRCL